MKYYFPSENIFYSKRDHTSVWKYGDDYLTIQHGWWGFTHVENSKGARVTSGRLVHVRELGNVFGSDKWKWSHVRIYVEIWRFMRHKIWNISQICENRNSCDNDKRYFLTNIWE